MIQPQTLTISEFNPMMQSDMSDWRDPMQCRPGDRFPVWRSLNHISCPSASSTVSNLLERETRSWAGSLWRCVSRDKSSWFMGLRPRLWNIFPSCCMWYVRDWFDCVITMTMFMMWTRQTLWETSWSTSGVTPVIWEVSTWHPPPLTPRLVTAWWSPGGPVSPWRPWRRLWPRPRLQETPDLGQRQTPWSSLVPPPCLVLMTSVWMISWLMESGTSTSQTTRYRSQGPFYRTWH